MLRKQKAACVRLKKVYNRITNTIYKLYAFYAELIEGDRKCYVILIQKDAAFPKNSPWNIAADFDVDMSFSAEQIAAMLWEYETDHHTGWMLRLLQSIFINIHQGIHILCPHSAKL